MNFLLNSSEDFVFGGQVVFIGMVTVFAVLGLLWGCLTIFRIVFYDMPSKRPAKVVSDDVIREETATPAAQADNDLEIVAVIAAAIAAAESESSVGSKFKVVSFKRK